MNARPPRKHDPVALVLGPTGSGPFALLGLPAEDVSISRVLAALHDRLEQVKASPHAATPAAEDVRLALHAAAAQLCDPAVRRLLLGTWGASTGGMPHAGETSLNARLLVEREVHIAVGLSGGWNAAAMQRLVLACQGRGVSIDELGHVLSSLATRPIRAATVSPPAGAARRGPTPSSGRPRDVVIAAIGGVLLVACVLLGLVVLVMPGQRERASRDSGPARDGDVPAALTLEETGASQPVAPSRQDLSIGDARSIGREMASLAKAVASDSEAGAVGEVDARFGAAFESFTSSWHLLRRDEITAVVSSLIDLTFASVQKQRDAEVIGTISRSLRQPPTDRRSVRAIVASGAVAARLLQERDLPRSVREQLEAALRGNPVTRSVAASARFDLAAEQMVFPLAQTLGAGTAWADVGAWKGFMDVRDAALGDRTRMKDSATLAGLQGVLGSAATENADEAIGVLASSLSWEITDDLRLAIRGWFDDPAVPTARLAALTRAMVKSSLRGVDSTMTLAATASREERQTLGDTLTSVLRDAGDPVQADVGRAWARAADQILGAKPATVAEAVDLAARMAELTAVRIAQIDGRTDHMSGRLEAALVPTTLPPAAPNRELPTAAATSRAIEYAGLGVSQAARVEFWKKRLADTAAPDLLLARVAIEEASRGSPAAVREAARDFVRARATDDSVLVAALDLAYAIPESRENLDWLSDIAGKRIPWAGRHASRDGVHRALLEIASTKFATVAQADAIDQASLRLARAWLLRIGDVVEDDALSPTEAARRVANQMMSVAGRDADGELRRRLEARLVISQGSVQAAVWWQAAVVEMTAGDIEKRSPRASIRAHVEAWHNERRRAGNVFDQLLAGERVLLTMLRAEVAAMLGEGA